MAFVPSLDKSLHKLKLVEVKILDFLLIAYPKLLGSCWLVLQFSFCKSFYMDFDIGTNLRNGCFLSGAF